MLIDGNDFRLQDKKQAARPNTHPDLKLRDENIKNKYQRRELKLRRLGKCYHCGQPCAPYYECETRRKYKNDQKLKLRCLKLGISWEVYQELKEQSLWQKKAKKLLKAATAIINYRESQNSQTGESEQVATSQT